jgi:hypothetical protein
VVALRSLKQEDCEFKAPPPQKKFSDLTNLQKVIDQNRTRTLMPLQLRGLEGPSRAEKLWYSGSLETWVLSPLGCYVTLDRLLTLPWPHFPSVNRDTTIPTAWLSGGLS